MRITGGILLAGFFCLAFARAALLPGHVEDHSTGKNVVAANVYLKHAKHGTTSDADGYFALRTPESGEDTLVVSMIGYQKREIPLRFPETQVLNVFLRQKVLSYEKEVLVTATRAQRHLRESSVSAEVIGREAIRSAPAVNVSGVLQQVASLQVRDYGGIGNIKTLSLRGASAGQVLVLLDGHPVNDPQNGEVDLSLIPAGSIEKIEVIRGGSSAIYGANALGGIVHMISRRPGAGKNLEVTLKNTAGSFNTRVHEGSVNAKFRDLSFYGNYEYLRSDGDFSYEAPDGSMLTRVNNDVKRHHLHSGLRYAFGSPAPRTEVNLRYRYLDSERGAPGTMAPFYRHARMYDRRHDLSLDLTMKSRDLRHRFQGGVYYRDHRNHYRNEDPQDTPVPVNDRYRTGSAGAEFQGNSHLSPAAVLRYGFSAVRETYEDLSGDRSFDRLSYALFALHEQTFTFKTPLLRSLTLTPSLRFNGNRDFSDQWTPKIGILMHPGNSDDLDIAVNAGISYRVPTFNDLYWPQDDYTAGNPDLEPEYGKDLDAGFRYYREHASLKSTFFVNRMSDLIVWAPSGGIWQPQNVSESRILGVENTLSLRVLKDHAEISCNYTFMDARRLSGDGYELMKLLPYRPQHSANFAFSAFSGDLSLRWDTRISGKRYTDAPWRSHLALSAPRGQRPVPLRDGIFNAGPSSERNSKKTFSMPPTA